jgi:beta-lactamase superfamily II metal-dependent hydrolase
MLRVHFLNVGHGDCTIISHPSGRLTMIDINNSQDYDPDSFKDLVEEEKRRSAGAGIGGLFNTPPPAPFNALAGAAGHGGAYNALAAAANPGVSSLFQLNFEELVRADAAKEITDPIEFLKKNYPGQHLFRFILTHPDLDHMRGLKNLQEHVGIINFWDTANTKAAPSKFKGSADEEDWKFYQSLRKGAVTGPTVLNYTRASSAYAFARDEYGNLGGDNIEILSPTPQLVADCNAAEKSNDLSITIRVRHGNKTVLLPGDVEAAAWANMVSTYKGNLKSDFLKASHHGRDSGFDLEALKLIKPILTFVSVGRKPDTDASSKYRQQCPRVASTRYHGNINLQIHDNGNWEWTVARNPG